MASRLALTARASEERPFCRLVLLFHCAFVYEDLRGAKIAHCSSEEDP